MRDRPLSRDRRRTGDRRQIQEWPGFLCNRAGSISAAAPAVHDERRRHRPGCARFAIRCVSRGALRWTQPHPPLERIRQFGGRLRGHDEEFRSSSATRRHLREVELAGPENRLGTTEPLDQRRLIVERPAVLPLRVHERPKAPIARRLHGRADSHAHARRPDRGGLAGRVSPRREPRRVFDRPFRRPDLVDPARETTSPQPRRWSRSGERGEASGARSRAARSALPGATPARAPGEPTLGILGPPGHSGAAVHATGASNTARSWSLRRDARRRTRWFAPRRARRPPPSSAEWSCCEIRGGSRGRYASRMRRPRPRGPP